MGSKTPPPTPVSEPRCQETTVTKVSKPILCENRDVPWILGSVPESEISQWHWEQQNGGIGKYNDDTHKVIIDPLCLPGLKFRQLQVNLEQRDICGTYDVTGKARDLWLEHAANLIRSEHHPKAESAYYHAAASSGLREELARAILVHDISESTAPVQRKLAQNLVLLLMNLGKNHSSSKSDQDKLLQSLQCSLSTPVRSERSKRDETQITSLFRALLELSGGRVDLRQHEFAEEYTVDENDALCASVFGITRTKQFGDFDSQEMINTLSKSPVFSGIAIGARDLERRTAKMMHSLHIGFPKGHLNLPSQVLSGFSVSQVYAFKNYIEYTYYVIPSLRKPENNILLLLTWSTVISVRQRNVLREWARSEDGCNLYKKLVRDVQDSQSVEQLTVIMVALMNYLRLLPDRLDYVDLLINGSYLADLDALFHGELLGNSGRVAEQMVFALVRILHSSVDQSNDLIAFVETALDRKSPLLYFFDRFPNRYLWQRTLGHTHETAMVKPLPELRVDDDSDWVTVTYPEQTSLRELHIREYGDCTLSAVETESSLERSQGDSPIKVDITRTFEVSTTRRTTEEDMTPSHVVAVPSLGAGRHLSSPPSLRADQYTLIRLSKVEDRKMLEKLCAELGTVSEVELDDGSWEICLLKSHRRYAWSTLGKMFPCSDVDLYHNPLKPTANDLKTRDFGAAKKLVHYWFSKRAIRIIRDGTPEARAFYVELLEVTLGLRLDQSLVPTFRGYLQSKEDAFYLLEDLFCGKLLYSCRGPQDGEATISGNVYAWTPSITGIDSWWDEMKWTVRKEDDFEVSEAMDGSGLMKKTISVHAGGAIHHVVSYYTPGDTRTLPRPRRNMTLRPELASLFTVRDPPKLLSCETANRMGTIPESIRKRMPQDLLRYITQQETLDDIPICEREPADVAFEVIPAGHFEIKVYFPASSHGKAVVFMHLPGGICKKGINRDRGWCSNGAKDSESIHASVDYRSASDDSFQQILTNCLYAYELVRQMCMGPWKEKWDTDPTRIVLSGSSFGATLAIIVAAIAARNEQPAYGLINLVPLLDTNPDLADNPWGENGGTLGLRPDALLADLNTIFQEDHPDFRVHWHSNPCKMPDEVVGMLPKTIMVFATLDILYQRQVNFKDRLQAQGVEVDWIEVDGLHQVKDMDEVTEAGRAVRQYVTEMSTEFVKEAKCSAGGHPGA